MADQWQAQLLAIALLKVRIGVFSEIAAEDIRRSHLEPVDNIGAAGRSGVGEERDRRRGSLCCRKVR